MSVLLSDQIKELRGDLSQEEFANRCGFSRIVVVQLESGKSVKFDTLDKIRAGFELGEDRWLDMVISWIREEVTDAVFRKLQIRRMNVGFANDSAGSKLQHLFELLSTQDREQILKTMERKEVRNCLPSINHVYDKFTAPDKDSAAEANPPPGKPRRKQTGKSTGVRYTQGGE